MHADYMMQNMLAERVFAAAAEEEQFSLWYIRVHVRRLHVTGSAGQSSSAERTCPMLRKKTNRYSTLMG
jgi:hypothetical protein